MILIQGDVVKLIKKQITIQQIHMRNVRWNSNAFGFYISSDIHDHLVGFSDKGRF